VRPSENLRARRLRWVGALGLAAAFPVASGPTNIQQTSDLVWTMVAIGVAGSIVTFSFLVYALWRFRDPNVKGRRYG
jgi:heme/copper-type cytochrome/quinol oxidase subunit 2